MKRLPWALALVVWLSSTSVARADIYVTGLGGDGSVEVESFQEGGPLPLDKDESVTVITPTPTSVRVAANDPLHAQGVCVEAADRLSVSCPVQPSATVSVNLKLGADTLDASTAARTVNVFLTDDGGDTVRTGPGADGIAVGGSSNDVSAGAGPDRLFGSGSVLRGEAGDDAISLSGGRADGGGGDDTITASTVCTAVSGGGATDEFRFELSSPVTISLDGLANDGARGGPASCNVADDIEILHGTGGDDLLVGNAFAQLLDGSGGSDELQGAGGADRLVGGPGSDDLHGGAGDDIFDEGPDSAATDDFTDTMVGGAGSDTVDYSARADPVTADPDGVADDGRFPLETDNIGADVERILGGAGPDVLTGGPGDQVLVGGSGDDQLDGGPGDDALEGGPGDDTLDGGVGADEILGGVGDADLADYSARPDRVSVDLDGAPGDDGAPGESDTVGDDIENLLGGAGDDTLTGNTGDNVLDGGPGADTMAGLAGADVTDYSSRTDPVTVDLDGQSGDDGQASEGDTAAADLEDVLGGAGDDILTGNSGDNVLDGGPGDDVLDGAGGPDQLDGGPGDDTVDYSNRVNTVAADLDGAPADDGETAERDTVGSDVENIWSGAGDDILTGNDQDNALDGGAGADQLRGLDGADIADYSSRTSPVTVDLDGQPRDDGAPGEADTVAADMEDLVGGSAADQLTGNDAQNVIVGGAGDDAIDGDGDSDALFGDDGNDRLVSRDESADADFCGSGNDTAIADAADAVDSDCETIDLTTTPTTTPQPAPSPTPFASPSPPPLKSQPDTTAPTLTLKLSSPRTLARLLRRGLAATVICSEPCTAGGRLMLDRRTARRLKLPTIIGTVTTRQVGEHPARVRIRVAARALKRIRASASSKLRLIVAISAVDAANNRTVKRRQVTVRRSMPRDRSTP